MPICDGFKEIQKYARYLYRNELWAQTEAADNLFLNVFDNITALATMLTYFGCLVTVQSLTFPNDDPNKFNNLSYF